MKRTGIWLDKDKALIVTLKDERETIFEIKSNVEHYRIHGGSGTRFKGGPQDVVQDSRYLEREKHQLRAYFKEIVAKVKDTDELVLFGPAQTYLMFLKELETNYIWLGAKVRAANRADSMTNNQVRALVRRFFKKT